MAKLLKRMGTQSMKFQFRLEVHALQMSVRVGPERKMSVKWARGPRVCTTPPVENCRKKELPARYEWGKNHPLLLLCTLYKDKNGKFQTKVSKITIRQHREGEKNEKVLGTCKLDLAENVNPDVTEVSKDLVFSLEKCADLDAELHITIHSKPITSIKLDHKEGERLSRLGSFSDGEFEAVDSLEDTPKDGEDLDDSYHEEKEDKVKDKDTHKDKDKDDKEKEKKKKITSSPHSPRAHDTTGFSSIDSSIHAQKTLINDLQDKIESMGGTKLKDPVEYSSRDKEEISKKQQKFIDKLQTRVTELSRGGGSSVEKERLKDRRGSAYERKEKEAMLLASEVKELRGQLDKARTANDILVQKHLQEEKKEEEWQQLKQELELLKKKRTAFKKVKAITDKEKAWEAKAAFWEEQHKELESTLLKSNAQWKATYEKQTKEMEEMKEHMEDVEKQLDEVLKLKEREKLVTSSAPIKGDFIPKETYLNVLAELAKTREDRLKLSQYMSKLEVEYVQVKVELVNTVDRCNTLEQQNQSLKELITKLDTDKTLAEFISKD